MGAKSISVSTIWEAIVQYNPSNSQHIIVRTLRIPRVIVALVVGASFAVSGDILLLAADLVARTIIAPNEMLLGIVVALIGANGSGKSTILKTMCRIMAPSKGQVILDGKSIHSQSTKELAKQLAILPQNPEAPEGLTVEELIAYGRSSHKSGFGKSNEKDEKTIEWALEVTSMKEFAFMCTF